MSVLKKFYYSIWNIGFIEKSALEVVQAKELPQVNWLKHNYKDRFFADPFILSVSADTIECLVEDFPFYDKRGYISKLIIDRHSWKLIKKKPIIITNYHQSFPYIHRMGSKVYIIPESSKSGKLICWELQGDKATNPKVLIDEPLLDPTFHCQDGLWWLFCTKRGLESDKSLHVYYADKFQGPYTEISLSPAKVDIASSRPAGYLLTINGNLHRVAQNSTHHYGEGLSLMRVEELTKKSFSESYVNCLYPNPNDDKSTQYLHTLNELNGITVIDGIKCYFRPIRRCVYELMNLIYRVRRIISNI